MYGERSGTLARESEHSSFVSADIFLLHGVAGIATPGISASLSYFDQYRREKLPANLVQAQRDFFGSHTYERNDGQEGWFHTVWSAGQSADSITTSGYKA